MFHLKLKSFSIAIVLILIFQGHRASAEERPTRTLRLSEIQTRLEDSVHGADRASIDRDLNGLARELRSDHRDVAQRILSKMPKIMRDRTSYARETVCRLIRELREWQGLDSEDEDTARWRRTQ